jgi:hypothetical protein
MEDHIKVRLKYRELVRAHKLEEAQEVLESIWNRKDKSSVSFIESSSKVKKPKKIEIKVEEYKFSSLNDLVLIKGIGKKTIKDIITMFVNLESLKAALILDNVALRDDIVEKLKEELI